MSALQEFAAGSTLFGGNAPYIEEQYERYLANPADVAGEWRVYFDSLRGQVVSEDLGTVNLQAALQLLDAVAFHRGRDIQQ